MCPFPSFLILISCRLPPSDSLFPTATTGDLGFGEVRCFCFLLLVNLCCLLPTVCLDLFAARDFGSVNSVVAMGLGVAVDLIACRGCGCGFGCSMGGGRECVPHRLFAQDLSRHFAWTWRSDLCSILLLWFLSLAPFAWRNLEESVRGKHCSG